MTRVMSSQHRCSACGAPSTPETLVRRSRCFLCRTILPVSIDPSETTLLVELVTKLWSTRGIVVGGAPEGEDDEATQDPWLELLDAWVTETKPRVITVEAALAGMGIVLGKPVTTAVRRRVKKLLARLGLRADARRFAAAPQYVGAVEKEMAKIPVGADVDILTILAALNLPADLREQVLIGRCLSYLGYRKCRVRRGNGRSRHTVYRKEAKPLAFDA